MSYRGQCCLFTGSHASECYTAPLEKDLQNLLFFFFKLRRYLLQGRIYPGLLPPHLEKEDTKFNTSETKCKTLYILQIYF